MCTYYNEPVLSDGIVKIGFYQRNVKSGRGICGTDTVSEAEDNIDRDEEKNIIFCGGHMRILQRVRFIKGGCGSASKCCRRRKYGIGNRRAGKL